MKNYPKLDQHTILYLIVIISFEHHKNHKSQRKKECEHQTEPNLPFSRISNSTKYNYQWDHLVYIGQPIHVGASMEH
jgi:hypothetical protein